MINKTQEVQCPSSSVTFECPSCLDHIECEIKIWAYVYTDEEGYPKPSLRAETELQPMWDHAFFKHTALE